MGEKDGKPGCECEDMTDSDEGTWGEGEGRRLLLSLSSFMSSLTTSPRLE